MPSRSTVSSDPRAAAIEAHFLRFLGRCGPSQHLLGNIEVTVADDAARSRANVLASHCSADPKDAREFVEIGRAHV